MTDEARTRLMNRLKTAQRARMARRGDLGPVVKALHNVADLMERDDMRARAAHGSPVGIPPSMGHHLIWQVCTGGGEVWSAEWVRLAREVSLEAAQKWSASQNELIHELEELVYPGGAHAATASANDVRAIADRVAAETS